MAAIIQLRRDVAANWTSTNPILANGEYGYETNTAKSKIGNGVDDWNTLPYLSVVGIATWGAIIGTLSDQTDLQLALDAKADAADLTAHENDVSNPHVVTQTQVGLSNIDNTSDLDKPISNDTQTALDLKADEVDLQLHTGDVSNPHVVTQTQVGLSNVDNTSDLDKPISNDTQTALDLKADDVDLQLHTGDGTIHFIESSIDHTVIQNIGTNSHAQIDTHIAGTALKHNADVILFDDSVVQGGFTQVQQVLDFYDDQIGLRETAATGVTSGGLVSASTSVAVNVAAGSGEIVDGYTDRKNPTRIAFSWSQDLAFNINMPNVNGTQVIYVDQTGTIGQLAIPMDPTQRRNLVQLAFITYRDGAIDSINPAGIASNEVGNTLYDWVYFTDAEDRFKGFGIEPVTNVLSIWAQTGQLFSPGINIANDLTDANIKTFTPLGDDATPAVFDVMFADGTVQAAAQTVIPDYFENPPGVIDPLGGNNATIHYMYRTIDNELILQLGQLEYGDAKIARDNLQTDSTTHTPFIGNDIGILTSQIYVEGNAPDFNDINDAGIVTVFGGTGGGGGGVPVDKFLDLTDVTDTSYVGKDGYAPLVNATETGLELATIVQTNITVDTGSNVVLNMVSLTQVAYDALTPVTTTLYIING